MQLEVKIFNDLRTEELYKLLQLRSEIFVVEQQCIYLDMDGKDQKALHLLGWEGSILVGYARIFGPGDYFEMPSIGRVAVRRSHRRKGLGERIMKRSMEEVAARFGTPQIVLSAQSYLQEFYADLGFIPEGDEYLEDGIPHIKMVTPARSE